MMGAVNVFGSPIDKKKWKKYAIGTVVASENGALAGGGYWQTIYISGLKFKPSRAIFTYAGNVAGVVDLNGPSSIAWNYPTSGSYVSKWCQYNSNPLTQNSILYAGDFFGPDSVLCAPFKTAGSNGNLTFNYIVFGE